MTKRETINRNIGLSFDLLRQVAKDPALLNKIPDGSTLEFIEKDFALTEKTGTTKHKKKKFLRVKSELVLL